MLRSAEGWIIPGGVVAPGFSAPIDVRVWLPGEWALLRPVSYTALNGERYDIPERFIMDFASIPQLAQALYSIDDETRPGALLHDLLYCTQQVPRQRADELLREVMMRVGSRATKRALYYRTVRAGGWVYWNARAKRPFDMSYDMVELDGML